MELNAQLHFFLRAGRCAKNLTLIFFRTKMRKQQQREAADEADDVNEAEDT